MRDRLMALINDVVHPCHAGALADYLLANGVIVPPRKPVAVVQEIENSTDVYCPYCETNLSGLYGEEPTNIEGRVDAIATAERCLDAFKKDHNTEHLVDAANYLMFRFMYPMPGEFFKPTDSSGSVGTVGTPINMERE